MARRLFIPVDACRGYRRKPFRASPRGKLSQSKAVAAFSAIPSGRDIISKERFRYGSVNLPPRWVTVPRVGHGVLIFYQEPRCQYDKEITSGR